MTTGLSFTLYNQSGQLPESWDNVACNNIFLSRANMAVLEKASPVNLEAHFIGLFNGNILCGVAVAQYIDLSRIQTFGKNEKQEKGLKNYLFKKFTSHTLLIGNNKLTGQNAYLFDGSLAEAEGLTLLRKALHTIADSYKKRGIRIHLLAVKDFNAAEYPDFEVAGFKGYYKFCTQPNMIFSIRPEWESIDDYLACLNTKYRTQYNRARKKADGIEKRKLSQEEIREQEARIFELYHTVAERASFNTFFLPKDHFEVLKRELKDDFLFYGYFIDGRLIGFNTLVKNGADMDTYFLGYDEKVQKEKMLYLNMLYDMVGYAIKKRFRHVVFARSAMEIKSSVGAVAEPVYGIIKHTNPILNFFMQKLFRYFDPNIEWKARSPFKS